MRVILLAASAAILAGCSTGQMTATNTVPTPQQASTADQEDDARIPPAFRAPRQQSGVGWPNIGYRPHGNY